MPWTGAQFKAKHNHRLSLEEALKAAEVANAMMRKGVPEGEAIRTANKRAKSGSSSLADVVNSRP